MLPGIPVLPVHPGTPVAAGASGSSSCSHRIPVLPVLLVHLGPSHPSPGLRSRDAGRGPGCGTPGLAGGELCPQPRSHPSGPHISSLAILREATQEGLDSGWGFTRAPQDLLGLLPCAAATGVPRGWLLCGRIAARHGTPVLRVQARGTWEQPQDGHLPPHSCPAPPSRSSLWAWELKFNVVLPGKGCVQVWS